MIRDMQSHKLNISVLNCMQDNVLYACKILVHNGVCMHAQKVKRREDYLSSIPIAFMRGIRLLIKFFLWKNERISLHTVTADKKK